jgi:putative ABC transport system permease protein
MQVLRLAVADLWRDWTLSLCQAFSLAAVLTPLLVLAGLHQGVLGQLLEELRTNSAMREIVPRVTGTNRFTEGWLADVRARPDVSFIVGDVRFTAASVYVRSADVESEARAVATLVPTGANDPLRDPPDAPWAVGADTVVLTDMLAREIGTAPGKQITLEIPRRRDRHYDGQTLTVMVAGVLPPGRMDNRRAILADATLTRSVQQFRDGFAIPEFGWGGEVMPDGPLYYERFRLYTRRIDDVAPMVEWLKVQGIEPVSREDEITPVLALGHGLSVVLSIIAAFAASGLAVAVAATHWSGVERKRHELALLVLIGYSSGFLVRLALLEALLLSIAGIVVALGMFQGAAAGIDAVFAHYQRLTQPACRLGPPAIAIAIVSTTVLTLCASAVAAWNIARIEPAATLRTT